MSREWTRGDVARTAGGNYRALRTDDYWVFDDGSSTSTFGEDVAGFRPLVVIDPDSPKDQRRLLSLLRNSGAFRGVVAEGIALDCIGDALREFANPTPPKPEEPTGLGAVVKDADGYIWVYHGGPQPPEGQVWYSPNLNGTALYAEITALKVLSEGVQS